MNELWDVILEQEKAKEILERIYESRRVPHAFLFYGQEGIGKFFTAIQFAKLLNKNSDETLTQRNFKKISSLQEPYIKLILPLPRGKGESAEDSSTEKLSKDVIELITEQIQLKISNPYHRINIEDANTIKINSIREIKKFIVSSIDEILYRFIIINDAHLMNEQAQNSLLKSLEEPPEGVIFVLTTSNKEKLLPTIQSRCWPINFEPLSKKSVSKILTEYFFIEKDLATEVSNFSDGSPIVALDLVNNQFKNILEKTISILRYSLAKKYHSAYKELSDFLKNNSSQSINILSRMIKIWLNDVIKNRFSYFDYYFNGYTDTLSKFNTRFAKADINKLFFSIDNLENLQLKNANLNVVSLNLIFELASMSIRK